MESIKKIPKRRFKGFTDAWEQRKLGELADSFEYGLNASSTIYDGVNKYIRITDIDESTRQFILEKVTSPDVDLSTSDNFILQKGDILFARTGASVGKSYLYDNKDGRVYFAGFLIRARVKSTYSEEFIFQNTLTEKYNNFVKITSQRSGQPGINAQEYSTFTMMMPKIKEEQTKIGKFFKQLDETITLQERKLNKLINIKKAYLEEMFPEEGESKPRRRFKGYSDDWKKFKLGTYATYRRGSFPQPYGNKEWYGGEGAMPFVQVVDVGDNLTLVENTKQKISKLAQASSVFVPMGKVIVTLQGSIGRVAITQYESYLDRTILIFEDYHYPTEEYFWAYTIQRKFAIEKEKAPGGTIKTITKEELSKFEICTPIFEEQQKIGNFFKQLDESIILQEQKLTKLKQLKSAYLEEMFV